MKITYQAVDGYRVTKSFKTLAGAQRFAHKWVGASPGLGVGYAVSDDGIGTIWPREGVTLRQLFRDTVEDNVDYDDASGSYCEAPGCGRDIGSHQLHCQTHQGGNY